MCGNRFRTAHDEFATYVQKSGRPFSQFLETILQADEDKINKLKELLQVVLQL